MGQVNYRKKPFIPTKDNRFISSPCNTNYSLNNFNEYIEQDYNKINRKLMKVLKSTDIENEIVLKKIRVLFITFYMFNFFKF